MNGNISIDENNTRKTIDFGSYLSTENELYLSYALLTTRITILGNHKPHDGQVRKTLNDLSFQYLLFLVSKQTGK